MKNNAGFTLIEVLIALVILTVALTAVIKAASQNVRDTGYLEQKNIADWVASNVINEVKLGLRKASSEDSEDTTEMLGEEWLWKMKVNPTPNAHIKKIEVRVFKKNIIHAPLILLESYYYDA